MSESNEFSKPVTVNGIPIPLLHAKEYEDPRDSKYLNALKLSKGFDELAKTAIEYSIERINTVLYTGSNVRVTRNNMPYLYECVENACRILNVDNMPDVYVREDPYINAFTTGAGNPILVFNNSILHRLTHEELMFIIGHEIGHIKSEHLQYQLMGDLLIRLGTSFLDSTVIGSLISTGLSLAFYEWERRAEFTADHAGLLVCQDLHAAITALCKLGGYPLEYYDHLDANDFLDQAQHFNNFDEDFFNKVIKTLLVMNSTHPWTVLRARELMLWVQSGEYSRILFRCTDYLQNMLSQTIHEAFLAKTELDKALKNASNAESELNEHHACADQAHEEASTASGMQALMAKVRKSLRLMQAQLSSNEIDRHTQDAKEAREELSDAMDNEKLLRSVLGNVTDEDIQQHTATVIGDLRPIAPEEE